MISAEPELACTAEASLPELSVLSRQSFIPAPSLLEHCDGTWQGRNLLSVMGAAMSQEWGHTSWPITLQTLPMWSSTDLLSCAFALPNLSLALRLLLASICTLSAPPTAHLPCGQAGLGCKAASRWAFFSAANTVPETSCWHAAPQPLLWGDLNYIASLRCASAV